MTSHILKGRVNIFVMPDDEVKKRERERERGGVR